MCQKPLTLDDGTEISCRSCNECVATRTNTWVARCMAEKAISAYTYALHLTYSNRTPEDQRGGEAFRYSDVRAFFARLRRQIEYHTGQKAAVRFIVCGERGSKKGRVHWHVVVFSDVDILEFGEFRKYGELFLGEKVDQSGKNRLDWSLWPHGFVAVQEPEQEGLRYVLKYALKDQFSLAKSKGTMRHHKAENYAASYFRMSKKPPIGHAWLWDKLETLLDAGQFPVSMEFKVPDYSGFWYPSGQLRVDILRRLGQYAHHYASTHNMVPAQEGAFYASLSDRDKEIYDGEEEEPFDVEDVREKARIRALEIREAGEKRDYARTRKRCGGILPCDECYRGLPEEARRQANFEARRHRLAYEREAGRYLSFAEADARHRARYSLPNPFCAYSDLPKTRAAFERDGRGKEG